MILHWNFILYFLGLSIVVVSSQELSAIRDKRRGSLIGKLKTLQHDVAGTLWAVDEDTIYIENFNYDGLGPDAFFWMGEDKQPSPRGILVPYPIDTANKKQEVLPMFQNENLLLHLPAGKKIADMKWFSVWCRRFTVDFGHVIIPSNLDPPTKRVISEFKRLAHGVESGRITILDAQTLYIPNLHYDGAGPDAFFWVGRGDLPDLKGQKVPNEIGSYGVLRGYEGEDIEIRLPDNLTVYDIDYLSIWCVQFRLDFGHVLIPSETDLWVPPALGQTRRKVPSFELQPTVSADGFDNCLQLSDKLQVGWRTRQLGLEIKLVGDIEEDQYMAFGISGDERRPQMINSDVVVAFMNSKAGSFHAKDYTITSKSMCDGVNGVCPDERVGGRNDASIISGSREDGVTTIIYSRPYATQDSRDIAIKNGKVTIVAAIGPLNTQMEANYHQQFVTRERIEIDFQSTGENTCKSLVPEEAPKVFKPWPTMTLRNTFDFVANIGPTGGERGYAAITGNPSWGISWWINGLLIPEIFVERGRTYTFTVEGGTNEHDQDRTNHHPFYITNSSEGGFHQKTAEEKSREMIFAGAQRSKRGFYSATAQGRLCEWKHKATDSWRESETFEAYKRTLHRACENGQPGKLVWEVAQNTPDLVFYQCYTHRHLGWKIHVVDMDSQMQGASSIPGASSMPAVPSLGLWLVAAIYAYVR